MSDPGITIVVPTRDRPGYLDVTLGSLGRQRGDTAHEILVVDDGAHGSTAGIAARHGVRCVNHGEPRSLNAARNTGVREARAALIAFVDDDVLVPRDWLSSLVDGARAHQGAEAFGGPIWARFEARFSGKNIPCPPFWGGFRIVANCIEFWQGQPHRLHDRLLFRRKGTTWTSEQLAP